MLIRMNYLHRDRKTQNYVYRRVVPDDLREPLGRREINRSLGTKDQATALRMHQRVHREVEQLLRDARNGQSPSAIRATFLAWMKAKGFNPSLALSDPALSEIERDVREDLLDDMYDRDIDGEYGRRYAPLKDPQDQPRADLLLQGINGQKVAPTLQEALDKYIIEKGRTKETSGDEKWRSFMRRIVALLGTIFEAGVHTQIDKITRDDAIRWRDMMIAEDYAQETVNKHYTNIKALIGRMYDVLEIQRRNPFNALEIKFDRKQSARDLKDPFTAEQEALVRATLPKMNREAQLVTHLMLTTGCRVKEACTLMREDIVLDVEIPHIIIRPNDRNDWTIKGTFSRKVPVVDPETLALLREFPDGPTRYQGRNGATNCSTAINKVLRNNGIGESGGRVSLYSARHTVKKKLLTVQATEYVIDEILGHSDGKAKDSYGDGVPLEVTAEWLRAALAH